MNKEKLLSPIETTNLNDSVYWVLRQWIIQENLSPGQRLNLSELEDHLQVSRTPIKMALKRLELEGFVDIQARRGTFIAPIDIETLDGNFKIRSAFELYIALCLFKYLNDDDYVFFEDIQLQMTHLANTIHEDSQTKILEYLELDKQFHEHLIVRGGPKRMLELYQQTHIHTQMIRILPHYTQHDFLAMHREHLEILSAIFSGSAERLSASLLDHLESERHRSLTYLSQSTSIDD